MKRKINSNDSTAIEQAISSIFGILSSKASHNSVVRREEAPKGKACKGFISIYNRDDLKRQEENKYYRPIPVEKYAFYPSVYHPSRLGSIAIYGENVIARNAWIKKGYPLFGYIVIEAKMETGIRPYLDVKLAP